MMTVLHITTTPISLEWLLAPQFRAFHNAGYRVVTASGPGDEARGLHALPVSHHSLSSFTREMSLGSDIRAFSHLRRLIHEVRPDIIHTHNPKPGIIGRLVGSWTKVPIVVNTVHGLYAQETDGLARRAAVYGLERMAAAHSDAELVQSVEDIETLRALGVPRDRLHLLGNGIDIDEFSPNSETTRAGDELRRELGIDTSTVVVGMVGRLVWEKGFGELFAAIEELRQKLENKELAVVIVGPEEDEGSGGVDRATLSQVSALRGVHVLGRRRDISSVMAAFDLFVLPSYREGFPRAAMEASAMGLPVIATNIRGCRQVVDDGVTGLLIEPKNDGQLSFAIRRLVQDRQLREEMGRRAREKALSSFDQRDVIDRTLAVYRSLLDQRGMPVPTQRVVDVRSRYTDSINLVDLDASNRTDAADDAAPNRTRSA